MAISGKLELQSPGNIAQVINAKVAAMLIDSYSIVDLDVSLKREINKQTGAPTSKALVAQFKITIKATKELKAPFYSWVNGDQNYDKLNGTIHIYDSTGFFSSTIQDVTGNAPLDYGVVNHLVSEELEDLTNYGMESASNYDSTKEGDIYDEMNKKSLISYIDSKKMNITVDKDDTEEILREKIRKYKELEEKSLSDLQKDATESKLNVDTSKCQTDDDKKKAYIEALVNNEQYNQAGSVGKQAAIRTADKLKASTAKTVGSIADATMTRVLESARSIYFENAECLSLKEHFKATAKEDLGVDSSYPWTIEITIRPEKITVTGGNVLGNAYSDFKTDINFIQNAANNPVAAPVNPIGNQPIP